MIEKFLRPAYQTLLVEPLAKHLPVAVTPDHITLLSLVTGLLAGVAIAFACPVLALLLLLLSGYCDTLDGTLARQRGQSSKRGAMLDIIGDRLVEFAVIAGLYAFAPAERAGLCLWMLGSVLICVTTFLVAGIFTANDGQKSFHYSDGLMERLEAFAFFIAMMLFPSAFPVLAVLFITLVMWTALVRSWQMYRHLDG